GRHLVDLGPPDLRRRIFSTPTFFDDEIEKRVEGDRDIDSGFWGGRRFAVLTGEAGQVALQLGFGETISHCLAKLLPKRCQLALQVREVALLAVVGLPGG